VSGGRHQFVEIEAVVVFEGAYLCLEPLAGLDVLEDVVAELFQGAGVRFELIRLDGREYFEGLFQAGIARLVRLSLFVELLQPEVVNSNEGGKADVGTCQHADVAGNVQVDGFGRRNTRDSHLFIS